jgi:alginate O-acetyltransferase complex protein AlgI
MCQLTEPWVGMWLLAVCLFMAAKWVMWRPEVQGASFRETLTWFFLWPGMDTAWLMKGAVDMRSSPVRGGVHLATGVALLIAAVTFRKHALLSPWLAMLGLINALHFGLFHLIACYWQRRGRKAAPLMDRPLTSRTLAEFWGRRWNTSFHAFADRLVFRPVVRRLGTSMAMVSVFLASGFVHELVISLPARGGWGRPTLYFIIQSAAILVERRGKLKSRLWVWSVTGLPLPLCFPPVFCERVILPMVQALSLP